MKDFVKRKGVSLKVKGNPVTVEYRQQRDGRRGQLTVNSLVLECLGPARTFGGNSGVKMASSDYQQRTEIMREPGLRRVKLAERVLGATVTFRSAGDKKRRKGRIVFADYDTLNLLIDSGGERHQLVSLRDCKVLALRDTSVPVLHGARLDVWQHGEGWEGVGIADPRVADAMLEPLLAVAA